MLQVRAKRVGGAWAEFTEPVYQLTGSQEFGLPMETAGGGGATTPAIVGAVVAVVVLILLVAVIVALYLRRGSDGWSEKQVRSNK